jgi:SAM-dependent methyltransferase
MPHRVKRINEISFIEFPDATRSPNSRVAMGKCDNVTTNFVAAEGIECPLTIQLAERLAIPGSPRPCATIRRPHFRPRRSAPGPEEFCRCGLEAAPVRKKNFENRPTTRPDALPLTHFASVTADTPLDSLNLNWRERDLPERERTKHVHRLHPYLGKFVPQLTEIFLRKFAPRMVCDPFAGSGTTLVEAAALGVASAGVDVSPFNCLIAQAKTAHYDLRELQREVTDILGRVQATCDGGLVPAPASLPDPTEYLSAWYHPDALRPLLAFLSLIPDYRCQDFLKVLLCRAARSARLTTHFELDFPRAPQREPYYCHKHKRVCPPTTDSMKFLRRYAVDGLRRVSEFAALRSSAPVTILCADSRTAQLPACDLVLTSPPYVGLIDYHEQHRYAYELLSLLDEPFASVGWRGSEIRGNEEREIGAARKGKNGAARRAYIEEIEAALRNALHSLRPGGRMCIVVGDRYGLYQGLAERLGLAEEGVLHREVNRRTGRRAGGFCESILIWRRL